MRLFNVSLVMVLTALLAGCGEEAATPTPEQTADAAAIPESIYIAAAPEGEVQDIEVIRANANEGDVVVVRGVVGGRAEPFVQSRAIMTIVGDAVENICLTEEDHCATPWDYCCASPDVMKTQVATVRIVDEAGQPVKATLGADGKVKPLSTVVIRGTIAPGSTADNLLIDAIEMYVEQI